MGAAAAVELLEYENVSLEQYRKLAGELFVQDDFEKHKDKNGNLSKETILMLAGAALPPSSRRGSL